MKLKYSFMSFSCPQASFDEMLALARQYGYDGVEPRIDAGHAHGIEANISGNVRREIQQKALDAVVAICCVATSCTFTDPQHYEQQLDMVRSCIDLASDIGSPKLRVFGGQISHGMSREEATNQVAESLEQVATYAEERNVVLCVETHDDWSNPAHLAEVMRRVNHPAIAVNWDIMHPVRQGGATMDEAFNILKPWIRHVHVHDGLKRLDEIVLKPIGQGEIDHRRALELLDAAKYDGYVSGEWINWEPYETHLPRELATMKSYER
jgi:sugar phosphate isomerase/epimerase